MATGKRPDPKRRKHKAPHSEYITAENGKTVGGYYAGDIFGCYAHRLGTTKGCRANITDDALPCPHCAIGMEPEWRGWVGIWDTDWKLRHALINEEILASVDAIPHRAKVAITRGKAKISPLIVREHVVLTRDLPGGEPWATPPVMLDVCLTLWKDVELIRWCDQNRDTLLGTKPKTESIAIRKGGKPFSPMLQGAAKKHGCTVVEPSDAVFEAAKNRLLKKADELKPSTNGNGKHE